MLLFIKSVLLALQLHDIFIISVLSHSIIAFLDWLVEGDLDVNSWAAFHMCILFPPIIGRLKIIIWNTSISRQYCLVYIKD